jgi:hypothetical protein
MTKGEAIVRVKFNPSADDKISKLKQDIAKVINDVEALDSAISPAECLRLKQEAVRLLETASMFAVKAATCDI